MLAIVTAVANAAAGPGGGAQATLDGYHAALFVPLAAALLGAAALVRVPRRRAEVVDLPAVEEALEEAA